MDYLGNQILNGLNLGAIYALTALGFAMVYGILKFLNFSHSEVFTCATYIAYFSLRSLLALAPAFPLLATVGSGLAAALGAGCLALLIERVAYRPLRKESRIASLVTAIGVSSFLQNIGIHLFSAHTRGFPPVELYFSPPVFSGAVLLLAFLLLYLIIYRTRLGLCIRAVSERPETAELMGLSPSRYIAAAFFLGGLFAGLAGIVWGIVYGTVNPQMGYYPGLKSFIVAVIGGIGNLPGTLIVGIALGVVEALVAGYLPSEYSGLKDACAFTLLLVVLAVRPHGLFGRPDVEKV